MSEQFDINQVIRCQAIISTGFRAANWHHLESIASNLRDGIPCKFQQGFTFGYSDIVRRLDFTDGTSWIAKVRLSKLKDLFGDREGPDVASTLKVEVASMKFLKAKTSVPVPVVHSYSVAVDPSNRVGAPYILMDYIDGVTAKSLRLTNECEGDLFGTPDQDQNFRKRMAEIQATISSFTFDQIGSLYQDEQTSEFFIGPDPTTGKGPWKSSMEYYNDLSNHALHVCVRDASPDVKTSSSFANPILFRHLMSLYSESSSSKDSYGLVNRKFGSHKLLVDGEFQIVGVIGFGSVMAAPVEVVAQYPVSTGLDREPPGCVEARPAELERIRRTEPKLKEYKEMLEASEKEVGSDDNGRTLIADLLLSDVASVFQGLLKYQDHQAFANDQWMEAYLKLIRGHFEAKALTPR